MSQESIQIFFKYFCYSYSNFKSWAKPVILNDLFSWRKKLGKIATKKQASLQTFPFFLLLLSSLHSTSLTSTVFNATIKLQNTILWFSNLPCLEPKQKPWEKTYRLNYSFYCRCLYTFFETRSTWVEHENNVEHYVL